MKAKAQNNPKVGRLARRLKLQVYGAVGILEMLWMFTRDQAPAGDIGRWDDADIAAAVAWDREPSELIEALVAERWLDVHKRYRLVVHDWSEHADDSLHRTVARGRILFADGSVPRLAKLQGKEREEAEQFYKSPGGPRAPRGHPMGGPRARVPSRPVPSRQSPVPSRPVPVVPPVATLPAESARKVETPGSKVFRSYAFAYEQRYDVPPIRDAKANSLTKKLVDVLGETEACEVSAFYVKHSDALYVRSGHCLDLLIRDAPKLRTEWFTGRRINASQARRDEQTEANPFLAIVAEERARAVEKL